MAISAAMVWEGRASGASDNNGGGFKAGAAGTDRSQQNAAQVAIDNSTITTSITANVITFTGYTPTSADVGNVVQMLTGTNVTAGFYEITAQTATTWTVTGAASLPTSGTTTNATGNMGGALATLSKLAGAMVASNRAFVTGAFTATATTSFAQTVSPSGAAPQTRLSGYGSARGDSGHATLTLSTNTGLTGISTVAGWLIEQIDVDCGSLGTSTGITVGNFSEVRNCKVSNFATAGINSGSVAVSVQDCEITGGTSAATAGINLAAQASALRCFVHDNSCTGIVLGNDCVGDRNLVVNNSGATSDGIRVTYHTSVRNNTCHNNGRDGINMSSATFTGNHWRNNILTSNGRYGITGTSATALPASPDYDGNAFFSNTSGARNLMDSTAGIYAVSPYTNVRDVTLTGSPYVGGTTGTASNFALNNTAGAGAACRAAGMPGTWPGNTGTTSYLDMGAVQHQDPASTGGAVGGPRVVQGYQYVG